MRLRSHTRTALTSLTCVLCMAAGLSTAPPASAAAGPNLVTNGDFESPSLSGWTSLNNGTYATTSGVAFSGSNFLRVGAGGSLGGGASTAAMTGTNPLTLLLAVRGSVSTVGKQVQAGIIDSSGGAGNQTSGGITLTPWWQTIAVTTKVVGPSARVNIQAYPLDPTWKAGDTFDVDAVSLAVEGPTHVTTSGRQVLVEGAPWTMYGVNYGMVPIGGTPYAGNWNINPAQCQTDSQLMRAAGINTLRISFFPTSYEPTTVARCADAMHSAGIKLMWFVPAAGEWEGTRGFDETFWPRLEFAINQVKDHPATMGYVIGNEIGKKDSNTEQTEWMNALNILAGKAKQLDGNHLTSTSVQHGMFMSSCGAPCWPGVTTTTAPNVDMWGINNYWEGTYGGWNEMASRTTRPIFFSEWGTDRYDCFGRSVLVGQNYAACSENAGSGENALRQAAAEGLMWDDMAKHLSATLTPDSVIVGGTKFNWADQWWMAIPGFVGGSGTPVTHDLGDWNGLTVEWFGANHAMLPTQTGPRVTTETYENLGKKYSGVDGPTVTSASVGAISGCKARATLTTPSATFARVDYGIHPAMIVQAGDAMFQDNYIADQLAVDNVFQTTHSITFDTLPGRTYRIYMRVFDAFGRPTGAAPLEFMAPVTVC